MTGTDIIFPNEEERLENLKNYKILNTKPEPIFDQLAAITAKMLDTPIAMINFIDSLEVWSLTNEKIKERPHQGNLCSLAVSINSVSVFENITRDLHLVSNALIAGEHGLKFYAAAPITTNEGFNLGSICIVDKTARSFNAVEYQKLEWTASLVREEMNKRASAHAVA